MRLINSIVAVISGLLLLLLSVWLPVRSAYCLEPTDVPSDAISRDLMERHWYTSPVSDHAVNTNNSAWRTIQVFQGKGNDVTPPFVVSGSSWSLNWEIEGRADLIATFRVHVFRSDKPYALWQVISGLDSEGKRIFPIESENGEEFFLKVFASNLLNWTIAVRDNLPEVPHPPVEIIQIHYKGTRYPRNTENCICYEIVEPDEYVVIRNSGERAQKMGGWTLKNITKGYPTFIFPSDFVLHPGQTVLVTTNEVYPDCGAWLEFGTRSPYCAKQLWFSFYFGPGDIWDNMVPNTAVLYDSHGKEVSRKSYTVIRD